MINKLITRKTLWISSLISGLGITTAFALRKRKIKKRKTLNRRKTKYLTMNEDKAYGNETYQYYRKRFQGGKAHD